MTAALFYLLLAFSAARCTTAFYYREERGRVGYNKDPSRTCLGPSGKIYPGGAMYSPNENNALYMQDDGSLVLYKKHCHRGQGHNCHCHGGVKRSNEERSSGCGIFRRGQLVCEWYDTVCDYYWVAIWSTSSSTYGQSPYWLEYSDYTGDLEVWVKNPDRVGWRAGTNTWGSFCIQNDGNLVLYSQSDNPVWASNTFSGWQKRSNSTEDTI